jgi:hypothetical protein
MKNALFGLVLITSFLIVGCNSVAMYPIDNTPAENQESRITGKWKIVEDTDKHNYYAVSAAKGGQPGLYHVIFWDKGGKSPTYEGNIYFSRVGGERFINVPIWLDEKQRNGYFFLRVLDVDAGFTKMATATVCDTTLGQLKSSDEVRSLITGNLKKPQFYCDTAHFYKVQ